VHTAAEVLRVARLQAGLSQRGLARAAGTSAAAVNRYERGQVQPTISVLSRLITACGRQLRLEVRSGPGHADPEIAEEVRLMRQRSLESRLTDLKTVDRMVRSSRRVR
jgi:transcriptional regulator with XRE-family HTH domain